MVIDRFDDSARRAVDYASEEARILNHNYVGTEHILLGLIREDDGIVAKLLVAAGVEIDAVRAQVKALIGTGGYSPSGHIPYTPRAKKVLELSIRESIQLGHSRINTGHILIGILRESESVAAQILLTLGFAMSIGDVCRAVSNPNQPLTAKPQIRVTRFDELLGELAATHGVTAAFIRELKIAAQEVYGRG